MLYTQVDPLVNRTFEPCMGHNLVTTEEYRCRRGFLGWRGVVGANGPTDFVPQTDRAPVGWSVTRTVARNGLVGSVRPAPVVLSGTRRVSPERPPVAAIGFVEGVNRYYR